MVVPVVTYWVAAIAVWAVVELAILLLVRTPAKVPPLLPQGEDSAPPPRQALQIPRKLFLMIVAAAAVPAVFFVLAGFVDRPPTFVDDLRTGRLTRHDLKAIEILDPQNPSGDDVLATVTDGWQLVGLCNVLLTAAEERQPRNHPQELYSGNLRVQLKDGERHELPFHVLSDGAERYAYLYSFHKVAHSLDQKCYESSGLVGFLQEHDPRFPK